MKRSSLKPLSRAAARALSITFFMSCGARNCPFLMFTGLPLCATAWMKSVCRAQERGRLQHIDDRCHLGDLGLAVHVGQHRHAEFALDLGQDLQPALHAGAAERGAAGTVGLVVARLEDEGDAQRCGDLLQRAGDVESAAPRSRPRTARRSGRTAARGRRRSRTASRRHLHLRCVRCGGGLVFQRRFDEAVEQRVAVPRRAT